MGTEQLSYSTSEINTYLGHASRILTANVTLYVATTGSDTTGDGLSGNPYKTITKALSMIPKNMNGFTATINISAGTYAETMIANGFYGGTVNIYGASALTNTHNVKNIVANSNTSTVLFRGFNLTDATVHGVSIRNCTDATCSVILSTVSATSKIGIFYTNSFGAAISCQMSNRSTALYAIGGIVSSSQWTAGSGNTIGLQAGDAATIGKYSTQPQGATAEFTYAGGAIR